MNPNMVVMGVSHSGTSPLTEMLYRLGWKTQEPNPHFRRRAETAWVKAYNTPLIKWQRGEAEANEEDKKRLFDQTVERVCKEPQPWAIKDPRFVMTLHEWVKVFEAANVQPVLLALCRPKERLRASFRRRSEKVTRSGSRVPGAYGYTVEQLVHLFNTQFDIYPWMKLSISYNRLIKAVGVINPSRDKVGNKQFGKAGW